MSVLFHIACIFKYKCQYFAETMDPYSRNLAEEEILEDIIQETMQSSG
jgi:hypothetical protein